MWEGTIRETVRLNNGVEMPRFGFGTVFTNKDIIRWAIQYGLRNIDTATDYDNEDMVGQAVKESGLKREEVFITTKVWNSSQGYEKTLVAFEYSLKQLDTDYVDLYLIHWPCPDNDLYIDTWKAMEKLYKDGRIRAIGVSNFYPEWIERIKNECEILPAIDQVEYHPFYQQRVIKEYCDREGIQMEAFSPLCQGKVEDSFVLKKIAAKYGKTCSQVTLRFLYQENIVIMPRSTKEWRIKQNFDIFDFRLDDEDMEIIRSLSTPQGRINMNPYTFHEQKNLKDQIKEREEREKQQNNQ
ncbi:MAG: aldo/keto reductase [Clostridia bacterium]|nr:aldo/keto reductase [Clostridia bacterium]